MYVAKTAEIIGARVRPKEESCANCLFWCDFLCGHPKMNIKQVSHYGYSPKYGRGLKVNAIMRHRTEATNWCLLWIVKTEVKP